MDQLLQLLGMADQVESMDLGTVTQFEADLRAAAADVDEADSSDETLEALQNAADLAETARTRMNTLAEDAEQRAQRIADLRSRIDGEPHPDEADLAELEGLDDDTLAGLADLAELSDDERAALAAPASDDDPELAELAGLEGLSAEDIEGLAAVVASSTAARQRPRISNVQPRRPAAFTPAAPTVSELTGIGSMGLTASANTGAALQPGAQIRNEAELAEAFIAAIDANKGYAGNGQKVPVVSARAAYPEHLQLSLSDAIGNGAKMDAIRRELAGNGGAQGLTASGGVCAPTEVRYDQPVVGTDARPVRDQALTRVGAPRGGVRTLPPPALTELSGAVAVWDDATGLTAGGASTGASSKPVLTVTCPEETETIVDAITARLQYGEFRARYFGEQISAWMELAGVAHARLAEQTLLAAIAAGSTNVTGGATVLGSSRDVLADLDRTVAGFRGRHRLPLNQAFVWAAPSWLRDNIRTDLARELPGATAERLATADAEIESFFAVRNIRPVWLLDGESGQQMSQTQNAGAVSAWPLTAVTYLYLPGTWYFLDGGMLNLGIVRDSTLNDTNDVQFFMETFEAAHFHGVESLRLVLDICADGSTSATVDIDPCAVGS